MFSKQKLLLVSLVLLMLSCSLPGRLLGTAPLTETSPPPPEAAPAATLAPSTATPLPATSTPTSLPPTVTPAPASNWQLAHRQQTADLPEQQFTMLVEYPYIEGSQQPETAAFNILMDSFVQSEIDTWQDLMADVEPLEGFELFAEVYYSLPTSLGWGQDLEQVAPSASGETDPLEADWVVLDAGEPVLSVLFVNFNYTGGAHPNSYHQTINYDFARAQALDLADLFRPGTPYLERISGYCIETLRSEADFFDVWEDGAAPVPENYQVWALTRQGMLIIFDAYQVAPYAAGPQDVVIPYAALADILDPDGPLGSYTSSP